MPIDEKWYAPYCVAFEERKRSRDVEVILVIIWVILLLIGLQNGFGSDPVSAAMAGVFLGIFGLMIFRIATAKEPARKKLWVFADTFCIEQNGKRGREYRFSEITRVRRYFPLVAGGGRMPVMKVSSKAVWQIYVGKTCVASFMEEMNNSGRLMGKLGSLGLITPYGTGVKPKR